MIKNKPMIATIAKELACEKQIKMKQNKSKNSKERVWSSEKMEFHFTLIKMSKTWNT